MINKTFSQLNAERAARRARPIKKKQKKKQVNKRPSLTSPQALGYYKIMKKEYYYLDKINFELIAQEKDKTINLNSSVLSDATLKKVLDDIEKNLKKTNKELM